MLTRPNFLKVAQPIRVKIRNELSLIMEPSCHWSTLSERGGWHSSQWHITCRLDPSGVALIKKEKRGKSPFSLFKEYSSTTVTSNSPVYLFRPMDLLQWMGMRWKSSIWGKGSIWSDVQIFRLLPVPFCLQTELAVNTNQMQTYFIEPFFFQLPVTCSLQIP